MGPLAGIAAGAAPRARRGLRQRADLRRGFGRPARQPARTALARARPISKASRSSATGRREPLTRSKRCCWQKASIRCSRSPRRSAQRPVKIGAKPANINTPADLAAMERERWDLNARQTSARPKSSPTEMVSLTIDGRAVTVPAGTSVMRAAAEIGGDIPKLCATDNMAAFGSCRLCLVEIDGAQGHARQLHHPGRAGHERPHPDPAAREAAASGVMELYISDHPLDCLTCSRQQRLRAAGPGRRGRPARRALRLRGRQPPRPRRPTPRTPISTSIPRKCIVCSPLRARLRRGPGHFRAHHRRARLRLDGQRRAGRRTTSSAPNASAAAPACRPARPRRCRKRASRRSASPSARWSPPAPIAASAAPSAPRCAASSSCAWCRGRTARPTAATRASRAASPTAMPTTRTASSSR